MPARKAIDDLLACALREEVAHWPADATQLIDAVWERIEFHGIALLLAEAHANLRDWPDPLRSRLQREAQMQVFWEESHKAALLPLFAALKHREIAVLAMKGTALAYSLYPQPAARRRGDTDLLIWPGDLAATRAALQQSGFAKRQDPHGLFFQETWLLRTSFGTEHAVDLHWQPTDSPALQNVLRGAEYFAKTDALPRLAPSVHMPDHVLTFVQGAINQAWHRAKGYYVQDVRVFGGQRLIWSLDNHLLANTFDERQWAQLAQLSIARAIAPVTLAALQFAREHIKTCVPEAVMQQLAAAEQSTALTRYLTKSDQFSNFALDLRASGGIAGKWRFLKANIFPSRDHLEWKYPRAARWPTPLLQLRRLGELALRSVGLDPR